MTAPDWVALAVSLLMLAALVGLAVAAVFDVLRELIRAGGKPTV